MPNYDEKTGIHFGVISPNSICQETLQDLCFGSNSSDPYWENMIQEIKDIVSEMIEGTAYTISDDAKNQIIDVLTDDLSNGYENPDGQMDYETSEYTLHISGDNFGIFVIRSPYYTFTKQCSPCAPGAGDLDNPILLDTIEQKIPNFYNVFSQDNHVKAYCLPKEFFDDEYSKIPYRYYRVDNDKEEITPIIEVK